MRIFILALLLIASGYNISCMQPDSVVDYDFPGKNPTTIKPTSFAPITRSQENDFFASMSASVFTFAALQQFAVLSATENHITSK